VSRYRIESIFNGTRKGLKSNQDVNVLKVVSSGDRNVELEALDVVEGEKRFTAIPFGKSCSLTVAP
jgi:hypothetical protein